MLVPLLEDTIMRKNKHLSFKERATIKFMLAFLRDSNTAASVFWVIEKLYWELRPELLK